MESQDDQGKPADHNEPYYDGNPAGHLADRERLRLLRLRGRIQDGAYAEDTYGEPPDE